MGVKETVLDRCTETCSRCPFLMEDKYNCTRCIISKITDALTKEMEA